MYNTGVKPRFDGKGDAWANAHRQLGSTYNMQDVDALFGFHAFGHNTGERLFLEYIPDDYANRGRTIRKFKVVAMFDRKTSIHAAIGYNNSVSLAFYLWLCRTLGNAQGTEPKFFFVIGGQSPPWQMIGVNIHTGQLTSEREVFTSGEGVEFHRLWARLGLSDIRDALTREVAGMRN